MKFAGNGTGTGYVVGRVIALEGDMVVAEAMRQINPDVVAAYPITPQTEVVQTFSEFVADGRVDTEFIAVEYAKFGALKPDDGGELDVTEQRPYTPSVLTGHLLRRKVL